MKKILTAVIALSLVATATLYGCSKKDDEKKSETTKNPVVQSQAQTQKPTSTIPVEKQDIPFEYKATRSGATIERYIGDATDVVIPAEIDNNGTKVPVTEIADYAFFDYEDDFSHKITSITIPEGVTVIGVGAFQNCSSVKSIALPSTLTTIGADAFYNTVSLEEVTGGENVTYVGATAFGDNIVAGPWYKSTKGKAFIMGDGVLVDYNGDATALANVKYVTPGAFAGCTDESLTFSDKLETLPEAAFDAGYKITLNIDASCPLISKINASKGTYIDLNDFDVKELTPKEQLKKAMAAAYPNAVFYGSIIIDDGNLVEYNDDPQSLAKVKTVTAGAFAGTEAEALVFGEALESIAPYTFPANSTIKIYLHPDSPIAATDISSIPGAVIGIPESAPADTTEQAEETEAPAAE